MRVLVMAVMIVQVSMLKILVRVFMFVPLAKHLPGGNQHQNERHHESRRNRLVRQKEGNPRSEKGRDTE